MAKRIKDTNEIIAKYERKTPLIAKSGYEVPSKILVMSKIFYQELNEPFVHPDHPNADPKFSATLELSKETYEELDKIGFMEKTLREKKVTIGKDEGNEPITAKKPMLIAKNKNKPALFFFDKTELTEEQVAKLGRGSVVRAVLAPCPTKTSKEIYMLLNSIIVAEYVEYNGSGDGDSETIDTNDESLFQGFTTTAKPSPMVSETSNASVSEANEVNDDQDFY